MTTYLTTLANTLNRVRSLSGHSESVAVAMKDATEVGSEVEEAAATPATDKAHEEMNIWLDGDTIRPLDVPQPTTYAEATNLALRYPKFASQILALPLDTKPNSAPTTDPTAFPDNAENLTPPRRESANPASRQSNRKGSAKRGRGSGAKRSPLTPRRPPSDLEDARTPPIIATATNVPSEATPGQKVAHTSSAPNWALAPGPSPMAEGPAAAAETAPKQRRDSNNVKKTATETPRRVNHTSDAPKPSAVSGAPQSPGELASAPANTLGDLRVYPDRGDQSLLATSLGPAESLLSKLPNGGRWFNGGAGAPQATEVDALVAALQAARVAAAPDTAAPVVASTNEVTDAPRQESRAKDVPLEWLVDKKALHDSGMSPTDLTRGGWGRGRGRQRPPIPRMSSGSPPPFLPAGFRASPPQMFAAGPGSVRGKRAPSPVMPARRASPFDMGTKLQRPDSAQARVPQGKGQGADSDRWITLDEVCAQYPKQPAVTCASPQPGNPRPRKITNGRDNGL
ncbi:hypothetical protein EIP91_012245 [Steccherinum ochraceum]|uniref:Uncharacterized protein n=1 Tax=Steccherinum ochraceum TaxID=92696 RepID=A0A4R0RUU7_9APHY|nr:hypothetical protein EIP91_012245 [Steccherinum ochraceum]